jgi:hypothetical protein
LPFPPLPCTVEIRNIDRLQETYFASDVVAVETILPAPSPNHAKEERRNGTRMHVLFPLDANAIEGLQTVSSTVSLNSEILEVLVK